MVTPASATSAPRPPVPYGGAITTVPPASSGPKISSAAMSNESEVSSSIRSAEVKPRPVTRFTTPRCGTITPLGVPVEPEV